MSLSKIGYRLGQALNASMQSRGLGLISTPPVPDQHRFGMPWAVRWPTLCRGDVLPLDESILMGVFSTGHFV
jgi:hypothetical protein